MLDCYSHYFIDHFLSCLRQEIGLDLFKSNLFSCLFAFQFKELLQLFFDCFDCASQYFVKCYNVNFEIKDMINISFKMISQLNIFYAENLVENYYFNSFLKSWVTINFSIILCLN